MELLWCMYLTMGLIGLRLAVCSLKFFGKCRNDRKVAVVYFRAGYTPNDYPSEAVRVYMISTFQHIIFCDDSPD